MRILPEWTEPALRAALAVAAPELARLPIRLNLRSTPAICSSTLGAGSRESSTSSAPGLGAPEFELRYLPELARAYPQPLDQKAVLAWNLLASLGDALWRTEVGCLEPGALERRVGGLKRSPAGYKRVT